MDTCCIDKKSSAELSEAINSMYGYYAESTHCYVYLEDIEPAKGPAFGRTEFAKHCKGSRWWSRGWTLQELVAPRWVTFYAKDWSVCGRKANVECRTCINRITGIPVEVLAGRSPLRCSVAQRMSWAALRHTTRAEDMAYCLLGLLDITMPLLYGEGKKAFIRLQEEVIKNSADQSLFLWSMWSPNLQHSASYMTGVFADSPAAFEHWEGTSVRSIPKHWVLDPSLMTNDHPYSMTNRGLSVRLPLRQAALASASVGIWTSLCGFGTRWEVENQ